VGAAYLNDTSKAWQHLRENFSSHAFQALSQRV
jgi:hypothetical protein